MINKLNKFKRMNPTKLNQIKFPIKILNYSSLNKKWFGIAIGRSVSMDRSDLHRGSRFRLVRKVYRFV